MKTNVRVIAWVGLAMAGGRDVHASRIITGPDKNVPGVREKRNRNMTRNIQRLMALTALAVAVSLHAEPTPSADRTSSKKANKVASEKSQPKPASKIFPAPPLMEGWNHVKGEWIHSDGYKYVNNQVVRTGAQTHRRPPKPPAKSLLNSVKIKPTPTPDPNSAAAKTAERERNLRPRPASQTGSNL